MQVSGPPNIQSSATQTPRRNKVRSTAIGVQCEPDDFTMNSESPENDPDYVPPK